MYLHKVIFDNVSGSNHGVNESLIQIEEVFCPNKDCGKVKILEIRFGYAVEVCLEKIDKDEASKIATRELYQYIDKQLNT